MAYAASCSSADKTPGPSFEAWPLPCRSRDRWSRSFSRIVASQQPRANDGSRRLGRVGARARRTRRGGGRRVGGGDAISRFVCVCSGRRSAGSHLDEQSAGLQARRGGACLDLFAPPRPQPASGRWGRCSAVAHEPGAQPQLVHPLPARYRGGGSHHLRHRTPRAPLRRRRFGPRRERHLGTVCSATGSAACLSRR